MPVDPQVQVLLDQAIAAGRPTLGEQSVAEARALMREAIELKGEGAAVARVENRVVPGPAGDIPVRIYWPEGEGPFPVLVWFHGGGWVLGDLDTADNTCRDLTVGAGVIVVSVDYRLAPEHPFPAGVEDTYTAACWAVDNAVALGGDPERVAVGGDSAGGNLAAVTALQATRAGHPSLRYQLLVYPCIDGTMSQPSYVENAVGYQLTADAMAWFYAQYLCDCDPEHPFVSPICAPPDDLAALPPALVITAEYDPLRDEGEAYAARLEQAGVTVRASRYDGQIHGFFGLAEFLDGGRAAVDEAAAALRAALH
jgi:acetyl esterase